MSIARLPEAQRRAIVRTAGTLVIIAFMLFVYTLWHGVK